MFRQITLADKALFERYVIPDNCRNCDMSFANIYCWQQTYHSQIAVWGDMLIIRFTTDLGRTAYMQPIGAGNKEAVTNAILLDAQSIGQPPLFFGLNNEWREFLERHFDGHFATISLPEHADYIYLSQDLASLTGRKYQPKRNHINRFVAKYDYHFEPINGNNIDHCRALNSKWCYDKGERCSMSEQMAVERFFNNFTTLGLEGWILYASNVAVAFAIGSTVNHDTFCIHIEKIDSNFEGAGAMINNLVATELQSRYKYINREDDLGIEGLRRSKMSYYPIELLPKYSAMYLSKAEREIIELWQKTFGDSTEDISEFIVRFYHPDRCLTHNEQGRIVSMLHIVPLEDQNSRSAYIYAVATDEQYRHRGIASQLLTRAIEHIEKSAIYDRIILIPASKELECFYQKFGFEATGEHIDFKAYGVTYDLGTGNDEQNFVMSRKIH